MTRAQAMAERRARIKAAAEQQYIDIKLFELWLQEQKKLLQKAIEAAWFKEPISISTNYRAAFLFFRDNDSKTTVELQDMGKYLAAHDLQGRLVFPMFKVENNS